MLVDKLRPTVKVYGPYTRPDGRQHVILYDGVSRKTESYPKWLMEQVVGRVLSENETVDHIDRDFTNNEIQNLQILLRPEHSREDANRRKQVTATCVLCGSAFITTHRDRKRSKAGPFCSKKCVGTYGAELQNKRTEVLGKTEIQPTYYRRAKKAGVGELA